MSDPTNLFGNLNAYHLADLADCASPDTVDSAGAMLLLNVAGDTSEAILWAIERDGMTKVDACEHVAQEQASEIADNAPNVYTHALWCQFSDLAAWQEDPTDLGEIDDMTRGASYCLYLIAYRLVGALCEEAAAAAADLEEVEA